VCYGRWGETDAAEEVVVCRRADDVVEIHCHGGQAAPTRILADLRQAECTEASWREIAGRGTDPLAAEALISLAHARTQRTAAILLDQFNGALRRELEATVSLIEQGETVLSAERIAMLVGRGRLGVHLTEPWRVVIAGAPNVGKSSLLNALVGYDRSIVVDSPGTTRDVVSAATVIDGWPVLLSDTAGLRASQDSIEAAGVALAEEQLDGADLVVLLFDRSQPWSSADQQLLNDWPNAMVVHNKTDVASADNNTRPPGLDVSAKTKAGLTQLHAQMSRRLVPDVPAPGEAVPFATVHLERLQHAHAAIATGNDQVATDTLRNLLV